MRNWDLLPLGLIIVSLAALFFLCQSIDSENGRLMSQCLADGKKEYECKSLLKQDYVPVFIPVGK